MSKEQEADTIRPFNSVDEDTEAPKFRDYIFKMKEGEDQIAKGFLAVAAGFVAVGTGTGDLSLVIPMDQIRYAREIPAAVGHA